MSTTKQVLSILWILILAGCVPSLHELYTPETLVFDPSLIGCWETSGGDQWYFIRHAEKDTYHLVIMEKEDKRSALLAHLADLDGQRYLDLYPDGDAELCTGDWYKFHLLGVHTFLRVEQTDPNLVLAVMQPDAVEELLEKKPTLIKHEVVDDRVVLTGSPYQLQAFLKNPEVPRQLFSDPTHLTPCRP